MTPAPNRSGRRAAPRPRHLAFAVTAPGLEAVTAAELTALGIAGPRPGKGGVSFAPTTRQLYAANLWLRTATRVVVRVARFDATSFAELEAEAVQIPWAQWLRADLPTRFRVTSHSSRLYHTGAIAERLHGITGTPGPGPGAGPGASGDGGDGGTDPDDADDEVAEQLVVVRVNHNEVTVSVDSSGTGLHRRGYRQNLAKAPLRENLAAAVLLAAGWDGTAPLVDPLCGSGTIAIEAALLARRIPPGQHRRFGFGTWPSFEPGTWASVIAEAGETMLDASPVPIVAADRDAGAIAATRANAERAEVLDDLELRVAPISDLVAPGGEVPGWLVANPPYGGRVGGGDLRDLYARIGQVARARLPGGRLALLVADTRVAAQTGLALQEQARFNNGGIPVRVVAGPIPT